MGRLDIETTAGRAGVDAAFVRRLADLDLIPADDAGRFEESAVRRVQLLRVLDAHGVSLEGVSTLVGRRQLTLDFLDSATYQAFSPMSDETFAQVSARTGIPIDLLLVVREAVGGTGAGPDDRVREDELTIVPLIEFQLAQGFRPLAIERSLRVYGDSLRRIAESEGEWWRSEIVAPMMAQGLNAEDIGRRAAEITPRLSVVSTDALLAIYRAQQRHVWTMNIVTGIGDALARVGLQERFDRTPAMCFLDITGYTRLTHEHGDAAAAQLAERLSRMVQRTSTGHGGRPVKWLGDGVMLYFPDPGPGVLAAIEIVEGVVDAGLPPAHVGLHAGPVLLQQGDYYGHTVNVASRIGEYARPGEVLVSQAVVDVAGDLPVTFRAIGPVEFKGSGDAIELYQATRRP
jgi:class 3 adenylate cyclase